MVVIIHHHYWVVGLVTLDNVRKISHGCISMNIYVCWVEQVGIDTPSSENPGLVQAQPTVKVQKALKRRAASCGENLEICGSQMHKYTGLD